MFDRFIRLARARKALQEGRFEDAALLADDPLIRSDRRAEALRRNAQAALARRGRQRLDAGDAAGAVRDLQRAVAVAPHPEAEADLGAARRSLDADGARRRGTQRVIDDARRLAEHGQLAAAQAMVDAIEPEPRLEPTVQALRSFLGARGQQAVQHRQRAAELLAQRLVDPAVEELRAARALDGEIPDRRWFDQLVAAAAARLDEAIAGCVAAGDETGAALAFRQRLQALPELAHDRTVTAVGGRLAAALLRRLAGAEQPEHEADLLQVCAQEPALPGDGPKVLAAAQQLQRLPGLRTAGRVGEVATLLHELADNLGCAALRREAEQLRERADAAAERLEQARVQAAAGDLPAARTLLVQILQELPMHEQARSELEAIDRGAHERERRLETARQAAKAGRLREAYGLALAHAHPGPAGEEARGFTQELRARMDLVGRGLDQVRAALHGRTSGGSGGLRHCLLRVEELAKVQDDHEDLPTLRTALTAELLGIERADAAASALDAGQYAPVVEAVTWLVSQRDQLLLPDRLDARILELADRLAAAAEVALAAGRLAEVEGCAAGVLAAAGVRPGCQDAADRLRSAAAQRRVQAETLAAEADALITARDLGAAEQRCDAARQLWVDGSAVRRIEDRLQSLRQQQAALDRVAALAGGGDVAGAHAELNEMPPTPALLRTRIFDMKQSLARAQGLDGHFLLRVDEGGEFLAVRGDSVSIGNLRDGRADLPILAAIAGRHARIQRSMSFHGGMQDQIVAEGGELRLQGARVASHRFAPGDRVQLGSALQFGYALPCKRSLTAMLQLFGGFQAAGTDRVLLFKDRGRDGRILIGPGKDVHVRVPSATGEVEVFANKTGQMRVRCDSGGEIDGRPFRDEHPIAAGANVRAAGIVFVLLPWVRG